MYYGGASFLIAIPFLIIAMLAQWNVSNVFKKYSRIANHRGMTGYEAAKYILNKNGIYDVDVELGGGFIGDHYDPKAKKIRLTQGNYSGASLLSVSVAAHEAGHAIQHATGYAPIKMRWAFIPFTQFGSQLAVPIAIGGFFFGMPSLVDVGIILYTFVVLFQIVTLPVEFNASSRAMAIMNENYLLDANEIGHARKILNAAALTYVAAAGVAVGELLRLIILRGMMGNRD